MKDIDLWEEAEKAHEAYISGDAVFYSNEDAEKIMNAKKRSIKRALPVRLTEDQHSYLNGKNIGKAEYIRNLLVIDMEKNK